MSFRKINLENDFKMFNTSINQKQLTNNEIISILT